MKASTMRLTTSLVVSSFCTLLATGAAAQGAFPPAVPQAPSASASPRSAWFERFQESRSGPESTDRWSRTFKAGPSGSLDLSNISGDIVITGGGGEEIRVEAVKRVHGRDTGESKRQLDAVTIEAREHTGRVEISTTYPRSQNIQVDVDYTVHVPAATTVSARSVSGNLQMTGVKGEARLETVSGNVTTANSGQLARVKSVSGDVSVSEGRSGEVLSVGTVSGNLTVRRLKARTLEVQTISGDLSLVDAMCERVQAKSISGDVRFGGTLMKAGRYEFNSHSGDVRLALQGATGFEISASSFSGDLRSDLALNREGGAEALPAADRERRHGPRRQELRGTFGDGSAVVTVQTFSGDLVVTGGTLEKAGGQEEKDKD
jgi:DUF4097 and DUF4098 domain-containing protein YvlB